MKNLNDSLETLLDFYSTKSNKLMKEEHDFDSLFFDAIMKHKLAGRINISEMKQLENSRILSKNFYRKLLIEKNTIKQNYDKQIFAIKEIIHQFKIRGLNETPIVIKGVSVFGLTNNDLNKRRSGDIDLIYSKPELLESILVDMGYHKKEKFSDHEYCEMYNDKVTIEIHNYIPVVDYTESASKKALDAFLKGSNIFFEIFPLKTDKLLYIDLISATEPCHKYNGFLIPNIYYQLLILCTHVFRNYVNSLFSFSSNIIIAELLDILDLINHSSFVIECFDEKVEETNSLTSVTFVAFLLDKVFGDTSLKEYYSKGDKYNNFYPKILQWSGAMYIPFDRAEFMYYGLNELLNHLNVVEFSLVKQSSEIDIPNIHRYNSHGLQNVLSLSITVDSDFINISIELTDFISRQTIDVFEIFTEENRNCFTIENNIIQDEEIYEGCSWTMKGKNIIEISLSFAILNVHSSLETCFALSVTRWGTGPVSTLIPIRVLSAGVNLSSATSKDINFNYK